MGNIMSFFPKGREPRSIQQKALSFIEDKWNSYDVFVLIAPTGSGKSYMAMTLANWRQEVDVITPTNILVSQYAKEFPSFPKLLKESLYPCCQKWGKRKHECERKKDFAGVSKKRGLMNFYMYMSLFTRRRKPASTLVVDEAHNLIPTLQSLMAKKLWQHQWNWPSSLLTYKDLLFWSRQKKGVVQDREKEEILDFVISQCETSSPTYILEKTTDMWYKTKNPERVGVLNLKPIEVSRGPSYYWGPHVKKLILMSATISKKDLESMGLDRRRVVYIECESPIPPLQRPIKYVPLLSVNKGNLDEAIDKLVESLSSHYLPLHKGERGVLHLTYELQELLKKRVGKEPVGSEIRSRLLFHTVFDKTKIYESFLNSPVEEGKVLVASGLYEGIDLPGEMGRWQIIVKVPWVSLADRAVAYKAEQDEEWYRWETLKSLIQASGRICRGPEDFGVTYVIDSSFKALYDKSLDILPNWFKEAVIWES